jgi:hypothetical protein
VRPALALLLLAACAHGPGPTAACADDRRVALRLGHARWSTDEPDALLVPVRVANPSGRRTLRVASWDLDVRGAGGASGCALRTPGVLQVAPEATAELTLHVDCDRASLERLGRLRLAGTVHVVVGTAFRAVPIGEALDVGG